MTARRRLRIGVIGLGDFAQEAILPAIRAAADVELAALVSGTPEKLQRLGRRHGVRELTDYAGLDALLARGAVDAVHIALPATLHASITVQCAERGVHVLCEKPMAPTEAECRAMIAAADAARIKLMVGYRLRFAPSGDARSCGFTASFVHQVRAGGTWDAGIYCIDAARRLFGAEPCEVHALPGRLDEPYFDDADEQTCVLLRFPGGRCATFVTGYPAHHHARCELACTGGELAFDPPTAAAAARATERERVADELTYFARCIRDDVAPEPSGLDGLAEVRVLLALDRSAEHGCAELLAPVVRPHPPRRARTLAIPAVPADLLAVAG
jgi:predicted dehydrogenase